MSDERSHSGAEAHVHQRHCSTMNEEKIRVLAGLKKRVREAESSVGHSKASRRRLEETKAELEAQLPRLNLVLEAAREGLEATKESIERIDARLSAERANEAEGGGRLEEATEELAQEEESCKVIDVDALPRPVMTAISNMKTIKGGSPVQPDDKWVNVWDKLRYMGWTYLPGRGLVDWYYLLPGGSIKNGKVGNDFFTSEEDVRKFAAEHFGWNDPTQRSDAL